MSIDAIGYVRSDVSGAHQKADEERVRAHAKHHGYNLRKTIVFGQQTDRPEYRLGVILDRMSDVEAVIVPNVQHFADDQIPAEIAARADVVIVAPPSKLARLTQLARVGR
ncbi:hypothetical protein C5E45_32745 [Nocardia nova]|uniref:Resolvase/invertase-type recombinase catalytic domain-containing protein n=1 Tax=Nocardia nova TaxID=37330 RepID=A0A2S6ACU9_9NOCA|nr:hypothetical protein [Nocardia nova]PPJ31860.1 hypothetical protein C5E45_32745 [Nocardia nova]